jgi:hypothetical protein
MTAEIIQPLRYRKWYEIWWDVWLHPGIAPFQTMLKEPNHEMTRGFIWVAVITFIVTLISYLFSALFMRNMMADAFSGTPFQNYTSYTLSSICGVILSPIFAIIGISVSAGIYHWVAKLFHGQGNWNELVFCLSAVTAPGTLVGGAIGLFTLLFFQNPLILFIPVFMSLLFAVYIFVLNVNAIRAVEDIGTWQAIGTIFIPTIIVLVLVACCAIVTLVPIISWTVSGTQ